MNFINKALKLLVVLTLMFALFLTGCTHMQNFNAPVVAFSKTDVPEKGAAVIGEIEDKRPAGTEMFIFSNPPYKWIYQCDAKPEQLMHGLIKEGLQRRGITEAESPSGALMITAEITDFSGHNTPGLIYVGNCFYKIGCVINIKGSGVEKTLTVYGNGNNKIGRLSEENMVRIMNRAYEDFLKNLDEELQKAGF